MKKLKYIIYAMLLLVLITALYFFLNKEQLKNDPTSLKTFQILITKKNWEKIEKIHQKSWSEYPSSFYKTISVPCKISFDGQTLPAKIRLKGTGFFHQHNDRRSIRVNLSGKNHINGSQRIDLEHPALQFFQIDKIFRDYLKKEHIHSSNMDYVKLKINDKEIGLIAFISLPLPSKDNSSNGVLLRSNNIFPNYWKEGIKSRTNWRARSFIEVKKYPSDKDLIEESISLIRAWQYGHLKASEVFDVQQVGRFLAILELWGAWHASELEDMQYYYNPKSKRFELVSLDPATQTNSPYKGLIDLTNKCPENSPLKAFLDDLEIRNEFVKNLKRITLKEYITNLSKFIDNKNKQYHDILTKEFKELPNTPSSLLIKRAEFFKKLIVDDKLFSNENINAPVNPFFDYFSKHWKVEDREFLKAKPNNFPTPIFAEFVHDNFDKTNDFTKQAYLILHNAMPDMVDQKCNYNRDIKIKNINIISSGISLKISNIDKTLRLGAPFYIPLDKELISQSSKIKVTINASFLNGKYQDYETKVYPGVFPKVNLENIKVININ